MTLNPFRWLNMGAKPKEFYRSELREEIDNVRSEIERKCKLEFMSTGASLPSHLPLSSSGGVWPGEILIRLCSLDEHTRDKTVANVVYQKGGYLEPHTHLRDERAYVVEGSFTDVVTNEVFREGDIQYIKAGVLHGAKSDHCILLITWTPPCDYN